MTDVTRTASRANAKDAGQFKIAGELTVNRLGFGAMRITGEGVWGEPADREEALRTLKRAAELGVNFIDTADSYGPDVSEQLIRQALQPYDGIVIATKAGLTRPGPNSWLSSGKPEYLISQAEKSREKLGVETIDLRQLHRIDPKVPRRVQFDAVKSLIDRKIIRFAGLSEVTVDDIETASDVFRVATVQNRYNLIDRGSEDVLRYCEKHQIGFIPWYPLGAGSLLHKGSALAKAAQRHGASAGQIALAWLLKRSPVILPIPGTSKVAHLEENIAAAGIHLSGAEFADTERAARAA